MAKRLELLRELIPRDAVVGVLVNPGNPSAAASMRETQEAANVVSQRIEPLSAGTDNQLEHAFLRLAQVKPAALLVTADAVFIRKSRKLAELATRFAIPTMHVAREFPVAGGLLSYGPSLSDSWRQIGVYSGRILNGAKPADLPVQTPTKFELIINLKTAKALGLEVPPTLLARADEVIE
jgi:putative ABC transport system substrate-binding protein